MSEFTLFRSLIRYFNSDIVNFVQITSGSALVSLSIVLFFSNNYIAIGGPIGLSAFINNTLDIDIWLSYMMINGALLPIGYKQYGIPFILKTIYCVLTISLGSYFFFILFVNSDIDVYGLVSATLSGLMFGIGSSLILNCGGSAGAWAVLAKITSDKIGIRIGTSLFILDALVIFCLSFTTSVVLDSILFGIVSMFFSAKTINFMTTYPVGRQRTIK